MPIHHQVIPWSANSEAEGILNRTSRRRPNDRRGFLPIWRKVEQVVRFTAIVGTKGAGMPVEEVRPISERAQEFCYVRRLSGVALDHECRSATLDCSNHTTKDLEFEPFHVNFYVVRRERQIVD